MASIAGGGRWVVALVAAAIVYAVLIVVLPRVIHGVANLSPTLVSFIAATLATAIGVMVGCYVAPRHAIQRARGLFFWIGMLVPVARLAVALAQGHTPSGQTYGLVAGGLVGGLVGAFLMILPGKAPARQPRRFG